MAASFSPTVIEFLQRSLVGHLATVNPSGSPQLTVMWYQLEDGDFLFTTTTDRVKFRNYQRDPRGALTVVDPDNMYRWVIVSGTFTVDDRDPLAFYRGLADHYFGPERAAEFWKTANLVNRTVLRLAPTRVRTLGFPQE